MDGIKLECNIYTFENAEHYISRLEQFNEKSGVLPDSAASKGAYCDKKSRLKMPEGRIMSKVCPATVYIPAQFFR